MLLFFENSIKTGQQWQSKVWIRMVSIQPVQADSSAQEPNLED